jgi:hypothetical protein
MAKQKKCKQCGKLYSPIYSSIQPVCSYICALKFNEKKEIDKRVKEFKVESQKLSEVESIARRIFQQWVRLRDAKLPCISCGRTESPQWDGSHYLSAELYSGMIFNEMNCNKACVYCNRIHYGALVGYRKGMIEKYGQLAVEGLEELGEANRVHKYERQELREIAQKYKLKIKNKEY